MAEQRSVIATNPAPYACMHVVYVHSLIITEYEESRPACKIYYKLGYIYSMQKIFRKRGGALYIILSFMQYIDIGLAVDIIFS